VIAEWTDVAALALGCAALAAMTVGLIEALAPRELVIPEPASRTLH